MEASVSVGPPPHERASSRLVRLGTDDQLVALFRSGCDEAFETIHDRYPRRLFGYARQLLGHSTPPGGRAAGGLLRASALAAQRRPRDRPAPLAVPGRAQLLRRPDPPARVALCDLHDSVAARRCRDPAVEAEQRETFRRLVTDMERLPDQQRSRS